MVQPDNTEVTFDSADPFRQSKILTKKQLEFNNIQRKEILAQLQDYLWIYSSICKYCI